MVDQAILRMDSIYVAVAVPPGGDREHLLMFDAGTPLVAATEGQLHKLKLCAAVAARMTKRPVLIVKFSSRELIAEIAP